MGLRDFFRPRQDNFIRLLTEQARVTLQGLKRLQDYMEQKDPAKAKKVDRAEKEADELRRILIDELNRTFVTPIDREDIFALSRAIDDVLDYAHTTVDEMEILNVEPNDYMRRMVSLLVQAGNEIHLAMQRLEQHPGVAVDHAQQAKALENSVERIYREAIAALFSGPEDVHHIMNMLKLREVYRHLSNAADRGDEAGNVISDIVVKMGAS